MSDTTKAAEDFIEIEIKPRDELEGWNCMTAYIAGFTLASSLHRHELDSSFYCWSEDCETGRCQNICDACRAYRDKKR